MSYGELCEHYAGMGISTDYAGNGVNPFHDSWGERDDDIAIRCDNCGSEMRDYTTTGACLDCDIKWLASHQLEERKL